MKNEQGRVKRAAGGHNTEEGTLKREEGGRREHGRVKMEE
jgi:hypothetical protein